jgi:hypothetical protein
MGQPSSIFDRLRVMRTGGAPLSDLIEAACDAGDALLAVAIRYRNETPLGHQPHMIASVADAAIAAAYAPSNGNGNNHRRSA